MYLITKCLEMSSYQTKYISVKKMGWKRIARNVQRFGWVLDDAEEEVIINRSRSYEGNVYDDKVYIKENVKEKRKVLIHLSFHRDGNDFENLNSISIIEIFYNIIYFIRKILAWILPIFSIVVFVIMLLGQSDELFGNGYLAPMGTYYVLCLIFWGVGILTENILANVASSILRYK